MKLKLTRKINFCCGQQYAFSGVDEASNKSAFGRLYSPNGWGHNYILEATIEGYPDKTSGMVMNLRDFDVILKSVTDPLDHQFLNKDVEYFKNVMPTSENVAIYLYKEITSHLKKYSSISLHSVRLLEGEDTMFEVST